MIFRVGAAAGKRFGWPLIDQAISSLCTLVLGVVVAHLSSPSEFGSFGLLMTCYFLVLSASRGAFGLPLIMNSSSKRHEVGAVSLTVGSGVLVATASVLLFHILAPAALRTFWPMLIFLPALLGIDTYRYIGFAQGRAKFSAFLDVVWAGGTTGTAVVTYLLDENQVWVLMGWGVSALLGFLFAMAYCGHNLSVQYAVFFLRTKGRVSLHNSLESSVFAVTNTASNFVVAYMGSFELVAGFRVLYSNVLGPVNMLQQALQPQLVLLGRTSSQSKRPSDRTAWIVMFGGLLPPLAIAALISLIPGLGSILGGESFMFAEPLVWPIALAVGLNGVSLNLFSLMRSTARPGSLQLTRLLSSILSLLLLIVGLASQTVLSLQLSIIGGGIIVALLSLLLYVRETRQLD